MIGKNDRGTVIGITNAAKLLEDIPNKVRDILGIMVDVDLKTGGGKDYLEIRVDTYPYPVSYKGQYHFRSGSTKQELKGAALDKFLLRKQGKHWDGVPVPKVAVSDLSPNAFESFRSQAARSGRLSEDVLRESNEHLVEKLIDAPITNASGSAWNSSTAARFRWSFSCKRKIGFFRDHADLAFQDVIQGDLFTQVDRAMDLLLTKYIQATIHYEGLQRVEELPYAPAALREALLNAVAHKDYSSGNPIQIRVYPDKIMFWNAGQLPENWTLERLRGSHPSIPYNPALGMSFSLPA